MKLAKITIGILLICALSMYIGIYLNQKKQFLGTPLPAGFKYNFSMQYKEVNIGAPKYQYINSVLFKVPNPKGVVLFLHGGGGNLNIAEQAAKPILHAGYDFIAFDYPGYGKTIVDANNQSFYSCSQLVYDYVKARYPEKAIILYGRSLGCAMAAQLASANHPKAIILSSPVYERGGLASQLPPFMANLYKAIFPGSVQYRFATHDYIGGIKCPLIIYCGEEENDCADSQKLVKTAHANARLITIAGTSHSSIVTDSSYLASITEVLKR